MGFVPRLVVVEYVTDPIARRWDDGAEPHIYSELKKAGDAVKSFLQ